MKSKLMFSFLLGLGLVASTLTSAAHGDEFKPAFVDSLVPSYLAVQTALAGDDLAAAQEAAGQLVATAQHGPKFTAFTTPASLLVKAKDIKAARAQFLTVSMEMQDLVDHVGTTDKVNLYEAHCSMAFGGKGGDWLQGDENVTNPYYGSMMLHCGSIKGQVAGAKSSMPAPEAKHDHGNH